MKRRAVLAIVGGVVAAGGDAGWALVIGDFGVAVWFWILALGALVIGTASAIPRRAARAATAVLGWTVSAWGAVMLLAPSLAPPHGNDFVAVLLFGFGPIVAAVAALGELRWRRARLAVVAGAAATGLGGLFWVVLDFTTGYLGNTWANACLAVGYGLLAFGLVPMSEGDLPRRSA